LRDGDTRVGLLAFELGYTYESAFSNAFKREVGMSPLRYRTSVRDENTYSPSTSRDDEIRRNRTRRLPAKRR
jgi:AraC-like DNA-binding protein